ncbi:MULTISPECIES: IS630 family transposase [unclassified Synechocystis]|uniref:IS630 family transposase n=1 Tax=unclassified Synechocystis TaxID=2640012 RepID=UPI002012659F|nr:MULTISPECIES: IS630 family transposase [unclassified Synechocystis]
MKQYAAEKLIYMDQAGLDDTLDYPYGYCHKSERLKASKLGHRTKRVSIISCWWNGTTIAPMIFEGYCNAQVVCTWIEEMLLPELIPGQILIMDNASFHPKERIKALVAKAGCEVIFLPPYSPDLNKIEKFWARLKRYVSQLVSNGESLISALDIALRELS